MTIQEEFNELFQKYREEKDKLYLKYVVTSLTRPNDSVGSPHKIPDNAMDFTLRSNGDYSGMREYKELLKFLVANWPYRAGADLTPSDGNVHIHIDLGQNRPEGQSLPFFFLENGGKFQYQIIDEEQIQ